MKSIKLLSAICVVLMTLASCTPRDEVISFAEVNNYFCKNDVPNGEKLLKLTNQKDFDRYFGAATTMGIDGKPTEIDFNQDIVIAKILPETDKDIQFTNVSIDVPEVNQIALHYGTTSSAMLDYKTRPVLLIAVDKKYANFQLLGAE